MKKVLLFIMAFLLVASPSLILASPGGLDQYGGHYCYDNCFMWDLADGQYHYHHIPLSPDYLSGDNQTVSSADLFYQPAVSNEKAIVEPITLQNSQLIANPALDVSYCNGDKVFAGGRYDADDNVRIKPVCVNDETIVRSDIELQGLEFYKNIPNSQPITKVYHQEINIFGKKVYTDRPHISELSEKLVKGETDSKLYYVYSGDNPLKLRPITATKAISLYGEDYQDQILYFDDSIIYSYPIGPGLN